MAEQALKRQAKEEEMQARKAELQRKREEENVRRQEHAAAIVVRKVIQRIRVVQPESFDALRTELETTLSEQLEKMGSLAEKIQQEAEKELMEAQTRMDSIHEKRAAEEKRKLEMEAKKQLDQERCDKLIKDTEVLVADAEAKLEYATKASADLEEASTGDDHEAVVKAALSSEELVKVAQTAVNDASKGLTVNWTELSLPRDLLAKAKAEFKTMSTTIAECRQKLFKFTKLATDVKAREDRRARALKFEHDQKELFGKFDSCGAGMLNREDIKLFAKETYDFDLPDEPLERIHAKLKADKGGVPYESFRRMRAKVAIERSVFRAREQRAQEEKRKAEIKAQKLSFKELLGDAEKALAEALEAATAAEAASKNLAAAKASKLTSAELKAAATSVTELVAPGQAALELARQHIESVAGTVDEESKDEVAKYQKVTLDAIKKRVKSAQESLDKRASVAKAAKGRVLRKECSEMEALRIKTIRGMGEYCDAKELTVEKLFEHIAKGSEIRSEGFVSFGQELNEHLGDKLDDEGIAAFGELFKFVSDGADSMDLSKFTAMLHSTYKVVKATMLSEGQAIDTKALRRLDEGEHVQGLTCPTKEAETGVIRVKCKAMKDDIEGWVSVAGNKGTNFLEPCSKFLVCLKETVITCELDVSSETVRKLNKDELLEVLQFPTKDPSCGVMRVKAMVKVDGTTGWISVAGNAGTTFLEAC